MIGRSLKSFLHIFQKTSTSVETISGFEVDSRKVQSGSVFFALKGAKVDGHDYLEEVAAKGALAAVVSKDFKGNIHGLVLIPVDDVLQMLQQLAKSYLEERPRKIVAITGSVGKTTTKEFIATLLEAQYSVFKTPGNANSQIGLPLSLLNAELSEDILVLEMAMMGEGEIRRLMRIAPPDVVALTKVAPGHLEFFSDGILGIARAKSEILEDPRTSFAVINAQASIYKDVIYKGSCEKVFFSLENKETLPQCDVWIQKENEGWVVLDRNEKSSILRLPFAEWHLRENFLCAALIARHFEVSWESIAKQALKLQPYKLRFEKIERDGVLFINDCYNANPESMKAALSNLPEPGKGARRIAALGHMGEMGTLSAQLHREIGEFASLHVDNLLCLGELCLPMAEAFSKAGLPVEHHRDLQEMKTKLFSMIKPGDVVLIKASNKVQLWRLLES